jgi:hypothetical protein
LPNTTAIKPAVERPKVAESPRRQSAAISAGLWAIVLFLGVNLALFLRFGDDKVSHNLWNGSGSIDIAIDAFSRLQQKPRIVLLGSSLMMYPFWAVDKQDNPAIDDIFKHRQADVFSAQLQRRGDKATSVFSFAIFGQMVSDAYLYVNEFLKNTHSPDYIVLGIAPRDFHDNDLPAPMSTISFRRLVTLSNFPDYWQLYLPSFSDQTDWLWGRLCYFYGHRWRLQHDVKRSVARFCGGFGIGDDTSDKQTAQAGFQLAGTPTVRWKNSLAEYKRRYTNLTDKDIDLQFGFLQRLLELCNQRHIKAIVVNMPLSDLNRQLLPRGFYDSFSKRMGDVTAAHQGIYLNLGSSTDFTHDDFWDSTHLNHFGGRKLIAHILPAVR